MNNLIKYTIMETVYYDGSVILAFRKALFGYCVDVFAAPKKDGSLSWMYSYRKAFKTYKHACEYFLEHDIEIKRATIRNVERRKSK